MGLFAQQGSLVLLFVFIKQKKYCCDPNAEFYGPPFHRPAPGRPVWYLIAEQERNIGSWATLWVSSELLIIHCPSKRVTVQESGEELPQCLTS